MKNYFLELYHNLFKMNCDGKDLDSILNALPWKEVKREDGTTYHVCEVKDNDK